MPLRITIELVPHGVESRKQKLAVLDIENDGSADPQGAGPIGNYLVRTSADCGEAGWDCLDDVVVKGVSRMAAGQRFYFGTAAACLNALSAHIESSRETPPK